MNELPRRTWLAAAALASLDARAATSPPPAARDLELPLAFPRDHGAHPHWRIEWWYATGWLAAAGREAPDFGFQVTFFRVRTGLAERSTSRFAARQLLFAHAAVTDLAQRRLRHAERIARWSGDHGAARAAAAIGDTRVHIGAWRFARDARSAAYHAAVEDSSARLALRLALAPTQPLLLQGREGASRKGPRPVEASHYYSQPQLRAEAQLALDGRGHSLQGRAWLDHEWSESPLPAGAVGWDWIGINLADGGALTAFRLRRADGSSLWSGGSHRAAGAAVRAFEPQEVRFEPLAWWTSPATRTRWPIRWRVITPLGTQEVAALLDTQELDARGSTGTLYWEGLAELTNAGTRAGLGYLEMTGYGSPLRLG